MCHYGFKEWLEKKENNDFQKWTTNEETGNPICTTRYDNGNFTITEYDEKGRTVFFQNYDGSAEWFEYDSEGRHSHYETIYAGGLEFESFNKYNSNGKQVYYEDSQGYRKWWYYDEKERLIYSIDSNGFEEYYEYHKETEKLILFRDSTGIREEYNKDGNILYRKGLDEKWFAYDSEGKLTYYKDSYREEHY